MAVLEQEFKEYRWLFHKLAEAQRSGNSEKIAKAKAKFEDWRSKHQIQFLEISAEVLTQGTNATIMVKPSRRNRGGSG